MAGFLEPVLASINRLAVLIGEKVRVSSIAGTMTRSVILSGQRSRANLVAAARGYERLSATGSHVPNHQCQHAALIAPLAAILAHPLHRQVILLVPI
jgi:hypothetical protein